MVHKTSLLEAISTIIETNTSLSSLLNFSNPIVSHDLIILLIVLFNIQFNIHLSHTWKKNCNDINVIIAICPGILVQDDSSSLQLSTPSSNYKSPNIDSSKAHRDIWKPVYSKAEFATYEAALRLSSHWANVALGLHPMAHFCKLVLHVASVCIRKKRKKQTMHWEQAMHWEPVQRKKQVLGKMN